jgi:hypothetical protein
MMIRRVLRQTLALMKEGSEGRRADRVVDIDVVEDNHRIEAAELHDGPLQKAPGSLRQHARRLDSADQIDDPASGRSKNSSAMAAAAPGA